MNHLVAALAEALIAEQRNKRRVGARVTLYTTRGDTLRGVLVSRDGGDYELRQVELALAGADSFRPVLRPVIVPGDKVEYYTMDSEAPR